MFTSCVLSSGTEILLIAAYDSTCSTVAKAQQDPQLPCKRMNFYVEPQNFERKKILRTVHFVIAIFSELFVCICL